MKQIDVEPTAEAIDGMGQRACELADQLGRIAAQMRGKNDITYASEAQQAILNFVLNSRLDLLIARPLREFMKDV